MNRTLGTGTDVHAWRHTAERAELVERVIAAESRVRMLERALSEYAEAKDDDPTVGSYVTALLARIVGMEANQNRLLAQVAGLEAKLRKAS